MATKPAHPLSSMQKLSDSVFLYRPAELATASVSASAPGTGGNRDSNPQVILLLGWMDARDAHLAWFFQEYRTLFPQASIVLVKARIAGLAFASVGRRDAQPAIPALRSILANDEDSEARLLIHAFSGGGSSSLSHLYGLYGTALPQHITIFDSTPGVWTYSFASNVFIAGLKNGPVKALLATPLAHLVAVISWVCIKVLGIVENSQNTWSAAHNDPVRNHETRRTYIYSNVDKMVSAATIEAHADGAEAKGFFVWGRELFEGSGHVAHAKSNPERYWRIVREIWAGGAVS